MTGPLDGVRVVELAGLAPAPFGCMLLADLGADVLRVDRSAPHAGITPPAGPLDRSRRRIALDLKDPDDLALLLGAVDAADVFIEGYRPGVAERLGIGPDVLTSRNPGLIYGRMTGWGQHGPLAPRAGHDINYVALAGALEPIGRAGERPHAPLNLLADFAGGGMLLALGVVAALFERGRSGRGQVVDAAMVDGASVLMSFVHGMRAAGAWPGERGTNVLDGGAPFYDTYRCADGGFVAVGCVEPQFFSELLAVLEVPDLEHLVAAQNDTEAWPRLRTILTERFARRARDEWAEIFADGDACVTPVLSPWEVHRHPHHRARDSFVDVDGLIQPAPAPRFGRSVLETPVPAQVGPAAVTVREWSKPSLG